MRRCALCQFHGCDTQGPDVGSKVIASLLDHFRSHPKRGANKGHALRFHVGELGGNTKVGQLDLTLVGEEDIGSFDVSMDFARRVEVVEPEEKFSTCDGNVCFTESSGCQLVKLVKKSMEGM